MVVKTINYQDHGKAMRELPIDFEKGYYFRPDGDSRGYDEYNNQEDRDRTREVIEKMGAKSLTQLYSQTSDGWEVMMIIETGMDMMALTKELEKWIYDKLMDDSGPEIYCMGQGSIKIVLHESY